MAGTVVAALSGCTFYTSCPTGNQNNQPNGNTAGSGSGGSGGSGNTDGGTSSSDFVTDGEIPDGDWRATMPDVPDLAELCGPVFYMTSKPVAKDAEEDEIIASIFNAGLWASNDGGDSWHELAGGKGSAKVNNRAAAIVYDPFDADTFWESGHYGPGVLHTSDGGETFEQLGDIMHMDGVSVDFSDAERKTLLVAGHESGDVLRSTDAGMTWDDITSTLPSGTKYCRFPLIFDSSTFLLGCGGYVDPGMPGTLLSTDGGDSWDVVAMNGGGAEPLWAADDSVYQPKEGDGGYLRSTDHGETWADLGGYKVLLPVKPVELPDGRIASLTEDAVVLSSDQGKSWKRVTAKLPFKPAGFTYAPIRKAFFIYRFGCYGSATPASGDEIQRFDFDYESY